MDKAIAAPQQKHIDDIDSLLDAADREASSSAKRLSHNDVFSKLRDELATSKEVEFCDYH